MSPYAYAHMKLLGISIWQLLYVMHVQCKHIPKVELCGCTCLPFIQSTVQSVEDSVHQQGNLVKNACQCSKTRQCTQVVVLKAASIVMINCTLIGQLEIPGM